MKNINNNLYNSMYKFYYKNNKYHMFANNYNKIAFLKINDDNQYEYPSLNELLELTYQYGINHNGDLKHIIRDEKKQSKKKSFHFIPKVLIGGLAIVLSYGTIKEIDKLITENNNKNTTYETQLDNNNNNNNSSYTNNVSVTDTNDDGPHIQDFSSKYGYDTEETEITESETQSVISNNSSSIDTSYTSYYDNSYLQYLALADDEYDYKWQNDYYINDIARLIKLRDSSGYSSVFNYNKPTLNELINRINANNNIDQQYKDVMIEFLKDWFEKYPDSDFSVLIHNIDTLEIIPCTSSEMKWAAISSTAAACYRVNDNKIYINSEKDINTDLNAKIEFCHEFMHACRISRVPVTYNNEEYTFSACSYDGIGLYYDEAVMTDLVYDIVAPNEKSEYYIGACNIYSVILNALGDKYTGEDYMNHSVNYLAEKIDEELGTENQGLYIIQQIDGLMQIHYDTYEKPDNDNFEELYSAVVTLYCKDKINSNTTTEEAEAVFDGLMDELTNNFEEYPYPEITDDKFRPAFEDYCEELGISINKVR